MKSISNLLVAFFLLVSMSGVFAGASLDPVSRMLPNVVAQPASSVAPAEATPMSKKEIRQAARDQKGGDRSWLVAVILVVFLGVLGIHRFYLGYPIWGLIFLLTGGLFGIGWLLDLIRILISNLKPKGGSYEY